MSRYKPSSADGANAMALFEWIMWLTAIIRELMAQSPDYPRCHHILGICHHNLIQWSRAITGWEAEEAAERNPLLFRRFGRIS